MQVIKGNIVDIFEDEIFYGEILIREKRIFGIKKIGPERLSQFYITPGLVDAHVHIESSMLVPSEFAKLAILHGTLGTVSDPHEIANVLGTVGVEYMIDNGMTVPFVFSFGVPSCVPATQFESAGAHLGLKEIEELLEKPEVTYLAEMMNFPAVISQEEEQLSIIKAALKRGKLVDGHAPGLRGEEAKKYFSVGISTDHECFTKEEATEKLELGVKVLIREGSAAKNFEALIPLAQKNAHQMMFSSDDKHPDDLLIGHINELVCRALKKGLDYFDVVRMASLNPIRHYRLPLGLLREGEKADFVVWHDKTSFKCYEAYLSGECVMREGEARFSTNTPEIINNFDTKLLADDDLRLKIDKNSKPTEMKVIQALDGQLITQRVQHSPRIVLNNLVSDVSNDVLKLVVYNRYEPKPPAIAFIKGFGLKLGAIASSVAHDSHNIIAVGTDDVSIVDAINLVVKSKGGISAVSEDKQGVLALPIAGIMSQQPGEVVAQDYEQIDQFSKNVLGSTLSSPFMTLSFMALLVIPEIKLSDKGLFDAKSFDFLTLTH